MIKLNGFRESLLFLLGSIGTIALIIIALHLLTGCATTPNSSYGACEEYCDSQKELAAYVTVQNGEPCQICKCYKSFDQLMNDAMELKNAVHLTMATPTEQLDFLVEMWNIQTNPESKKDMLKEVKYWHKMVFGKED